MTKNLKYEITNESILVGDKTLYRIKSLKDFNDVKKGDLGGYIEKENNLSQDGDCWVYGNAVVYDGAWIYNDAQVFGNAQVYGGAQIYGNAWVTGDAKIFGYTEVYGDAYVSENAKIYGNVRVSGDSWIFGNTQIYGDAIVSGNAVIYGDAQVFGNAHVSGDSCINNDNWNISPFYVYLSKHSVISCSYTHIKIGCKILSIDEWKQMGKELGRNIGIPDEDIELYFEAIRLAEIHIDLVKRNVKMKEEIKRWRAEIGGKYWIAHDDFTVCVHTDNRHSMDDVNYKNANYFRNKEEAQAAADEMRKVLLRHAGELHDFTWAVDEMKKGNKVRCWMWGVLCYLEIKQLYEGSISYEIFDQKGNHYELSLSDLEAADWEIFNEEE